MITTFSSRQFNQNASKAKKAAQDGPVFITDRGKPAHVLLSYEEYKKISGKKQNIVDLISMPAEADLDIEFPRLQGLVRPIDLS
jgi:prevent-host-death family protein